MDYTLKVTICPTEKQDTFRAHLFIVGTDDNRHIGAAPIYAEEQWAMHAHRETDAQLWALYVLRDLVSRLDTHVYGERTREQAPLMVDLFEHPEI